MTETDRSFAACRRCGENMDASARFCSRCGSRRGAGDTLELAPEQLPEQPLEFPATVHHVEPRVGGLPALPLLCLLGTLALVVAVVLFSAGAWAGGIILLALAVTFAAGFLSAAKRDPDSPLGWLARSAAESAHARTRLARVSLTAWTRAARQLLQVRNRRRRLHAELNARLEPLGEAVYRDEHTRAAELQAEARALDAQLREHEREKSAAVQRAREEVERERGTSQPTQSLPVEQAHAAANSNGNGS